MFEVRIVRVGPLKKHENADTLSIARVYDYPVIVRTGDFVEGDLAAYVPVDAVVPDMPEWAFLAGQRRIRAKKLRGTFSMGLLTKPPVSAELGEDVAARMGIVKYEEPPPKEGPRAGDEDLPDPGFFPTYTKIADFRRYPGCFNLDEEVVVTEKLHGGNARFLFRDGALWVGSHDAVKKDIASLIGRRVAVEHRLASKLERFPGVVVFGEIFGAVQDLRYGAKKGEIFFRAFDVLNTGHGQYLSHDDAVDFLAKLEIPMAPALLRGKWAPEFEAQVRAASRGQSMLGENMREGVVIKPTRERWDDSIGRVILKLIGEDYLLRRGGTERH